MFESLLSLYGIDQSEFSIKPYGNGLINHTWKIVSSGKEWLWQRINQQVFKKPLDILDNCSRLSAYFKHHHPGYLFISPVVHAQHRNYVVDEQNNYYRLFPFVKNSFTVNEVSKPAQAYEAARQFGQFTRLLSNFDIDQLQTTLPDFHNLILRQEQFERAVQQAHSKRKDPSLPAIRFLQEQIGIVETFKILKDNTAFPVRVTHHDAKINNVLFELGTDLGLCVIDLDTVMPGYYISDVGDMLRTYLSPAGEEDPDFSKIEIREDYFQEILRGYFSEMHAELTQEEKKYFIYAGKFAIYMQAIRFLTDWLENDTYYAVQFPEQNLLRANNQVVLLKRFLEKEDRLKGIFNSLQR
jgi:Ser/Thr protein kinase RdoA (MazF antagonist)